MVIKCNVFYVYLTQTCEDNKHIGRIRADTTSLIYRLGQCLTFVDNGSGRVCSHIEVKRQFAPLTWGREFKSRQIVRFSSRQKDLSQLPRSLAVIDNVF